MDNFQKEIDERTNLTSTNKFELLLFRVGTPDGSTDRPGELYGINVFKIREIVPMMPITAAAGMTSPMLGMVNIRGQVMSVVDLSAVTGCRASQGLNILLITEFARHTQAFAVESVEEIVRLDWSQVLPADAHAPGGLVTSIARMDTERDGGRLVQVLDVEHILNLVSPMKESIESSKSGVRPVTLKPGTVVLAADDSRVARALIEQCLKELNLPFIMATDGLQAWNKLQQLSAEAEAEGKSVMDKVAMVLTDLEMPEMDGFTLTRKIKSSDKYKRLPVVIHSSLTGAANEDHVRSVGADGYVAKFAPSDLAAMLGKVLPA
ncbi:chemotaxis protein [Herbaspirillum sp.]|jgi:two-component system chemotaxis response regulator CheV|uniref:chemotaxis protein n=1 Tax=Herbaspirillum TaxID=963 RepID=UPI00258355D6|nr:chemotaxis protein [Herbaspirillum sp.]MCP3657459.1 chemotaxis protein CheV [Herbaspirillum sp.]MCP3949631.1 chemotaxis protein CheV [Herbaspirillum sp.]MCP4034882.1 chemotaxis protein CheV [Herbaspirillum sp.]MCP4556361.1 chemotaxis protein CheV [Herbaspirillum sp.]